MSTDRTPARTARRWAVATSIALAAPALPLGAQQQEQRQQQLPSPAGLPFGTRVRITAFTGEPPIVGTLLATAPGDSLRVQADRGVVAVAPLDVARFEASGGLLATNVRAMRGARTGLIVGSLASVGVLGVAILAGGASEANDGSVLDLGLSMGFGITTASMMIGALLGTATPAEQWRPVPGETWASARFAPGRGVSLGLAVPLSLYRSPSSGG